MLVKFEPTHRVLGFPTTSLQIFGLRLAWSGPYRTYIRGVYTGRGSLAVHFGYYAFYAELPRGSVL